MKRDRTYHDLTLDERAAYDALRAEQQRARRAKPPDWDAYHAAKAAADSMLGLRPEDDTRVVPERDPSYRTWRGSASPSNAERRKRK